MAVISTCYLPLVLGGLEGWYIINPGSLEIRVQRTLLIRLGQYGLTCLNRPFAYFTPFPWISCVKRVVARQIGNFGQLLIVVLGSAAGRDPI